MKQKLSIDELITHMKNKGIKFDIVSEQDARKFLTYNNYYLKLASYRANYDKCSENSQRKGQYQNLDFGYLKELSTIDMHLRYIIIEMCLDIEHFIKVRLVSAVTDTPDEDGYNVVKKYLKKEDPKFYILKMIHKHKSGEYCKNLIEKYYPYFPIWVLVELISFGDLLHICRFYEKENNCTLIANNKFMNTVRDFRNAAAHSNCLMNKMTERMEETKQPDIKISQFIKQFHGISKQSRAKYLNMTFTYNIVTLLYVYNELVPIDAKRNRFKELCTFVNSRVVRHKEYFYNNPKICGTYSFLKKVIDNLSES